MFAIAFVNSSVKKSISLRDFGDLFPRIDVKQGKSLVTQKEECARQKGERAKSSASASNTKDNEKCAGIGHDNSSETCP